MSDEILKINESAELDSLQIINKLDNEFSVDWGVETINAPKVWNHTKGKGVKVAVIDSGIDSNHPDLADSIKKKKNVYNHMQGTDDAYSHGTMVAGLIVGKRTGVAPDSELYIAKVLHDDGLGTYTNILDGITFAIANKVDILCMSLGMDSELPKIMRDRIQLAYRKGVTIVCAVGNSNVQKAEYPAFYDNVIAVGGIDKNLERANFSNYGFEMDVVAPAVDILSTYKDGRYAKSTGTSFASPLVAGGLALVKAYYRDKGIELTPVEMKSMLKRLSKRADDRKDRYMGYGIMDVAKILELEN